MLLFVWFLWEAYAKIKFTWVNDCKKCGSRIKIRERKVRTAFSCKAVMMLKERREKGTLNRGSLRVQCILKKILARSLGGPSAEATHQVHPTSQTNAPPLYPRVLIHCLESTQTSSAGEWMWWESRGTTDIPQLIIQGIQVKALPGQLHRLSIHSSYSVVLQIKHFQVLQLTRSLRSKISILTTGR